VLALYIVVYLLVICDMLMTYYALYGLGLSEGNPLMRLLIERFGIHMAVAVVMLVVSAVLIFVSIVSERVAVVVMILLYSGVVAWNAVHILLWFINR